jgi:hypothetical protein
VPPSFTEQSLQTGLFVCISRIEPVWPGAPHLLQETDGDFAAKLPTGVNDTKNTAAPNRRRVFDVLFSIGCAQLNMMGH